MLKLIVLVLPVALLFLIFQISKKESGRFFAAPWWGRAFMRSGYHIYVKLESYLKQNGYQMGEQRKKGSHFYIKKLYLDGSDEEQWENYVGELSGLGLFGILFFAVVLSILISGILPHKEIYVSELNRPGYGADMESFTLVTRDEDGMEEEINLDLSSILYTEEEFLRICDTYHSLLMTHALGENVSWNHVTGSLDFSPLEEFFFIDLTYESRDGGFIDSEGMLCIDSAEIGENKGSLFMRMVYESYEMTYELPYTVWYEEKKMTAVEALLAYIKESQLESRFERAYRLPENFDGKSYSYQMKEDSSSVFALGLMVSAVFLILFYRKPGKLKEDYQKRQEQLLHEYPDLIARMMILMRAGMPVKRAWKHMVEDYDSRKGQTVNYAYEEMKYSLLAMENGVSEAKAYLDFGKRCGISSYSKLGSMLEQNLKKGNQEILIFLESERILAIDERKRQIKAKGEVMGSKLMLPMVALFGLVMVIIMVPAFSSIQM